MDLNSSLNYSSSIAPNIGFAALMLGATISAIIPFLIYLYRKSTAQIQCSIMINRLLIIEFIAFLTAQLSLIRSFIISDYSVKNVFENSHHLKPLFFKISATWGSHEGSMLLLLLVLSSYGIGYFKLSFIDSDQQKTGLAVQNFIIFLFCTYCLATSNPFIRLNFMPQSGLGLNPILQDIGLGLHPPMLYLGYLGFSLVFSHIIAGLLTENFDQNSLKITRSLLGFTLAFLSLGIGLGSWWAYRELGWGGYWFWDPVENVSLMPWIAGIAMLHSLKLAGKNHKMLIWSIFLAITTMILCLLGIFLTRSGILSSVHAFAVDNQRALAMNLIIAIVGGFGFLVMGLKLPKISSENSTKFRKNFWLIVVNNYLMLIALLIILIGTLYSPIALGLFDQSVSIGSSYYNQIFSWLILPILWFLCLASIQKPSDYTKATSNLNKNPLWYILWDRRPWGQAIFRRFLKYTKIQRISVYKQNWHSKLPEIFCFFVSLILVFLWIKFVAINYDDFKKISTNLFLKASSLFLAVLSVVINLKNFVFRAFNQFSASKIQSNSGIKTQKFYVILSHLGFSLLILGVFLNSFSSKATEINLKIGDSFEISDLKISFDGVDYKQGKNFIARQGIFKIKDQNKNSEEILGELHPELRYYPVGNQTTNESAILHRFFAKPFGDIYLVIGNKDEANNYAIRAYVKPFMFLIWLGFATIFISLMSLFLQLIINFLLIKLSKNENLNCSISSKWY